MYEGLRGHWGTQQNGDETRNDPEDDPNNDGQRE